MGMWGGTEVAVEGSGRVIYVCSCICLYLGFGFWEKRGLASGRNCIFISFLQSASVPSEFAYSTAYLWAAPTPNIDIISLKWSFSLSTSH